MTLLPRRLLRFSGRLLALLAACYALLGLGSAPAISGVGPEAGVELSKPKTIPERVEAVRRQIAEEQGTCDESSGVFRLTQFYNFPNFPNFPNFRNFQNFPNFPNFRNF
jgi:hypothetical protein